MGFRLAAYAAFVLSGVAGLVYEVLWTRYLGLLVGHSAYAQVIVLAVFLGGMGAGALLVGARSARLADPLRWYARIEILIGLFGFAFDPVFRSLMGTVFERLLPAAGTGPASLVATWAVACLAILPQSLLLGATFPLMTAGILRRQSAQPGRVLAMLYGANSGGAAVGALAAGFLLIPALGLPGAVLSAAVLNLVAGAIAFVLSGTTAAESMPMPAVDQPAAAGLRDRFATVGPLLLTVAAGTAIASFLYEVAWIRMLALLLSSATHAFEIMLSAFILGLALGAFWVRRGADGWKHPVRALGIIQFVMGCAALATLLLYQEAYGWMVWLMQTFARTDAGYVGFSVGRYAISLAIMLPATFCAGATLPLITRVLLTRGVGEAAIGRVYGVNTLGSIVGVVLAGLILLPLIGLKALLITGAALDIALGVLVLAAGTAGTTRRLAVAATAAGIVLVGASALGPNLDRQLLASGVFRTGTLLSAASIEPLYHEDGRTATVTVYRALWAGTVVIATNGKPDGSLPEGWLEPCVPDETPGPMTGDVATQTLAPLITLAHRPDADRAAIIGFGSGMSSHLLLTAAPALGSLVTIEIEPAMLRAARLFLPANRRAYDDPRSTLVIEDARAYFARTGEHFDYIFSEPSNPWVAGVSGLFTTEFYARVRGALTDDGVFGQWLHLYELNDELVQSVLAAIHENFGAYVVYQVDAANILVVASPATLPSPQWSRVFAQPALRQDLCHTMAVSGDMMEASRIADRPSLAPLLDGGAGANADLYPVLDLGAERARYLRQRAAGLMDLAAGRFDFVAALHGSRLDPTTDSLAVVPDIPRQRAQATAAALRGPGSSVAPDRSDAHSNARHLLTRWRRGLDAGIAPSDWATWLTEFDVAEHLVHGATRGFVDRGFYDRVDQFVEVTAAPEPVRHVVQFRRGLASWDFALVREAGLALTRENRQGLSISQRDLMEGLITAHLLLGDARTADSLFQSFARQAGPAEVDLRLLLLGAHVQRAREARRGPTPR
ncbi:MAG: fused MFS/spermidine synthase [Gemmatimonadota bacterium]|nr:fused MFS/spermidine synthase [Gemmatimonadota bacterium]